MITVCGIRIIPTRVGKSSKRRIQGTQAQDHPHACGDKSPNVCNCPSATGSSPRVWGQDQLHTIQHKLLRIIPTRVGTSSWLFTFNRSTQDHPHACGDKNSMPCIIVSVRGSSPRVWGQGHIVYTLTATARIIPTRVGTSSRLL